MVKCFVATLAILVLAPVIGGVPTLVTSEEVAPIFSFSKWVEGIIANPDGDNLSPEQVVKVYEAAIESAEAGQGSLLQKRVTCNTIPNTEAYVPDAVWCIDYLARLGNTPCVVGVTTHMCTHGRARITGVKGGTSDSTTTSACNDVARAGGLIMDSCTRADNTVQGSDYAWGNNHMAVHIRRPS